MKSIIEYKEPKDKEIVNLHQNISAIVNPETAKRVFSFQTEIIE